jgi:hypothetical protein
LYVFNNLAILSAFQKMNFLAVDENSKDLKGNTEKNNEIGVTEKGSKIKSTSMLEMVDLTNKTNDKFQNILTS